MRYQCHGPAWIRQVVHVLLWRRLVRLRRLLRLVLVLLLVLMARVVGQPSWSWRMMYWWCARGAAERGDGCREARS